MRVNNLNNGAFQSYDESPLLDNKFDAKRPFFMLVFIARSAWNRMPATATQHHQKFG